VKKSWESEEVLGKRRSFGKVKKFWESEEVLGKRTPLLGQEGWLRIKKWREATSDSADGVVILPD